MEFRTFPNCTEQISTIGIGSTHLQSLSREEMVALLDTAEMEDVNLIDFAMPYPETRDCFAAALQGRRDRFVLQGHLGCTYQNGQYVRTRAIRDVAASFDDLRHRLDTEYIDLGVIHYVDEPADFDTVYASGMFEYADALRRNGSIHLLGFSTHNVETAERFLDAGGFDFFMFSINPAYDLDPSRVLPMEGALVGDDGGDATARRARLYARCVGEGVGITVMKPFAGGILLDPKASPFGQSLTIAQCLRYALDRPAVVSCLLGVASVEDLRKALEYYRLPESAKFYAIISAFPNPVLQGRCVYCNHCLPCPAGIDIASLMKFLDLAVGGDELARQHYANMTRTATDCITCGSCEKNCPFGVPVIARMQDAVKEFRK